ncbi:unnamed protein product [Paramecium sonneborni]|uniref:Uncharacterized protein n=1 Tax=Paramecium sonneborni TaxID=65129 RepID=A0A8S1PGF1_9CILI|nr:unnamed protein product [Paramecium sonneborni]
MTINLKFQQLNDTFANISSQQNIKISYNLQNSCSTDRVRKLVNKVKAQSKQINNTHDIKLNRQLQQFKILDTFIDTKAQLKKLNILNNRDLLESVKNYLKRRKIARQLDQQEVELKKMHEQFEVKFETEFDKAFLDSDFFLDLGLVKVPTNKSKVLSKERLYNFNIRTISQYQSSCEQKSNRDQVTKSQYDQNLFYFYVEDHIEQIKKEKQEIDNWNQKIGKSIKCRTQTGDGNCGIQVEQQKINQIDYDKELYKIVLQYGIDLNSTELLEEDIYLAFKQQANEFIKSKINEAKMKHNQNIKEDQLNYIYQIKAQKKKISSIFEQQLFNISKQLYPNPKSRYRTQSNLPSVASENRKSQIEQEQINKKKQKMMLLNQFNLKSKRIINMCNKNEQKLLYNEFITDMQLMNLYMDEAIIKTNFNRKLSQLGFTKEDQILTKKQILFPGESQ